MTIAQQLKIKDFPFVIKDKDGKQIYYEYLNNYWTKYEYDANGKQIYYEDSNGYWVKREYNANGKEIYYEISNGYWVKREYNANDKEIYWENSNGVIKDKRSKTVEVTLEEIAAKLGIKVEQLRIKE